MAARIESNGRYVGDVDDAGNFYPQAVPLSGEDVAFIHDAVADANVRMNRRNEASKMAAAMRADAVRECARNEAGFHLKQFSDQPAKDSPVRDMLMVLATSLRDGQALREQLEERLAPALAPRPEQKLAGGAPMRASSCDLHAELIALVDLAESENMAVRMLISRVAL